MKTGQTGLRWTTAMREYLRENFPTESRVVICSKLGLQYPEDWPRVCRVAQCEMGLKRSNKTRLDDRRQVSAVARRSMIELHSLFTGESHQSLW